MIKHTLVTLRKPDVSKSLLQQCRDGCLPLLWDVLLPVTHDPVRFCSRVRAGLSLRSGQQSAPGGSQTCAGRPQMLLRRPQMLLRRPIWPHRLFPRQDDCCIERKRVCTIVFICLGTRTKGKRAAPTLVSCRARFVCLSPSQRVTLACVGHRCCHGLEPPPPHMPPDTNARLGSARPNSTRQPSSTRLFQPPALQNNDAATVAEFDL